MEGGDFFANEQSVVVKTSSKVTIKQNGKVLREIDAVEKEILDATYMSVKALRTFLQKTF